jgi:hypothetical protein
VGGSRNGARGGSSRVVANAVHVLCSEISVAGPRPRSGRWRAWGSHWTVVRDAMCNATQPGVPRSAADCGLPVGFPHGLAVYLSGDGPTS